MEQKEQLWKRLSKFLDTLKSDSSITKEKYLRICETMNREPSEAKCPPDIEDFPEPIQYAISIFFNLNDIVFPEIGLIGKDYSTLSHYIDVYQLEEDKELVLECLSRMDKYMQKQSAEKMAEARKKLEKRGK